MEFAEKTQLQQSSAFICCASEQQNDALKKIQKQYEVFTKMKKNWNLLASPFHTNGFILQSWTVSSVLPKKLLWQYNKEGYLVRI